MGKANLISCMFVLYATYITQVVSGAQSTDECRFFSPTSDISLFIIGTGYQKG